ncbi:hypothetical protein SDD30_10405 [Moorella naiadis]|uniref:hypothetical protein n=1 Tax=Moorella naiadis (nom. illeg.) TaxID=3093670 RepID=UPI003D9C9C9D
MKTPLAVLAAAVLLAGTIIVPRAFAVSQQNQPPAAAPAPAAGNFVQQMIDQHLSWVDSAEKNGQLTPEQAQSWRQHLDSMRDFHTEYGLGMMGGNYSGFCHGGEVGPSNNTPSK